MKMSEWAVVVMKFRKRNRTAHWIWLLLFAPLFPSTDAFAADQDTLGRPAAGGHRWDPYLQLYDYRSRFYHPAGAIFISPDTFEGLEDRPASQHRYNFVERDPVNRIDPSGHLTLTEVETSMAEQFKLAADAVSTVYRGYNTAMNVIDAVETFRAFAQIVYSGDLVSAMTAAQDSFASLKVRHTGQQIASEFAENFVLAAPYVPSHWAPPLFLDLSGGRKIKAFLIYLPTPVGMRPKAIPTGIKIRKHKVELVVGGRGSGRLTGVGIQVDSTSKQFFRMDFHPYQQTHGNPRGTGAKPKLDDEIDVWNDPPFHYHVMQYRGESNK